MTFAEFLDAYLTTLFVALATGFGSGMLLLGLRKFMEQF